MQLQDHGRTIEAATLRAHRLRREAIAKFWRDVAHVLRRVVRSRNQPRWG
jgi:hypothetical protein